MSKTAEQLRNEAAALQVASEKKIEQAKKIERTDLKPQLQDAVPEAQALERVRYEMQTSLASHPDKKKGNESRD